LDNLEDYKKLLRKQEGLSLRVYQDSLGVPTIGYGRSLSTHGISFVEAEYLLDNDVQEILNWLSNSYPWYKSLDLPRKVAILSMRYQLGAIGFMGFKQTLEAMGQGNWALAAEYMGNSKWAKQTPERVKELQNILITGKLSP
jgi:Phage-related lysozyme (muraminidase)